MIISPRHGSGGSILCPNVTWSAMNSSTLIIIALITTVALISLVVLGIGISYVWPFGYPEWSRAFEPYRNPHHPVSHFSDEVWWQERVALNETRLARREKKKRMKLARAQGIYRPNHVPGAWME